MAFGVPYDPPGAMCAEQFHKHDGIPWKNTADLDNQSALQYLPTIDLLCASVQLLLKGGNWSDIAAVTVPLFS